MREWLQGDSIDSFKKLPDSTVPFCGTYWLFWSRTLLRWALTACQPLWRNSWQYLGAYISPAVGRIDPKPLWISQCVKSRSRPSISASALDVKYSWLVGSYLIVRYFLFCQVHDHFYGSDLIPKDHHTMPYCYQSMLSNIQIINRIRIQVIIGIPVLLIRFKNTRYRNFFTFLWIIFRVAMFAAPYEFKSLLTTSCCIRYNYSKLVCWSVCIVWISLVSSKLPIHFDRFANIVLRRHHHIVYFRV